MPPPPVDEQDLDALGDTTLEFFKAEPPAIGPFSSSHLSWKVNAPDRVSVQFEGAKVPKSGSHNVSPESTHVYRLTAKAGQLSKPIGTVAVQVNLGQCIERDTGVLHLFLAPFIKDRIEADTSGIYFRNIVTVGPNGSIHSVRATPQIWITPGRLHILLQLGQNVNNFPDPDVDISVSFGLAVVADSNTILGPTKIVPFGEEINVDISFPWYAWLVPGAQIGLPIAIDFAKERARKKAAEMIRDIVGPSAVPVPGEHNNLNTFFEPPSQIAHARKHGVRLFVDSDGHGVFAVRYCPQSGPVIGGLDSGGTIIG